MRTIHEYPLELVDGYQPVATRWWWRAVHVAMQDGKPTVWAEVRTDGDVLQRRLLVVGTGYPVPDGCEHVGSAMDGQFVWHVYVAP